MSARAGGGGGGGVRTWGDCSHGRRRGRARAVTPQCEMYTACDSCAAVDDCAWCASQARCLFVADVFYTSCRGAWGAAGAAAAAPRARSRPRRASCTCARRHGIRAAVPSLLRGHQVATNRVMELDSSEVSDQMACLLRPPDRGVL